MSENEENDPSPRRVHVLSRALETKDGGKTQQRFATPIKSDKDKQAIRGYWGGDIVIGYIVQ